MNSSLSLLIRCAFIGLLPGLTRADIKLHGLFSDNMVLQRDVTLPVWGWADEGEEVMVRFRGQTAKAVARNGQWSVRLNRCSAGGPDALEVTGKNAIALKNVMVGEVWIASGQSNMEWPMRSTYDAANEMAGATNSLVRLHTVPKLKATAPTNNVPQQWHECGPDTVTGFSAVAYYFARDLQRALNVPVGVIHTSWGGSPAEVWMRHEVLFSNPEYKRDVIEKMAADEPRHEAAVAQWEVEQREAAAAQREFKKPRPSPWRPSELYNGMIAPLIPFAIKGAIWYQGESNAGRAWQYRTLFADMIRNWRRDWGQGDFPFLLVQLAPFKAIKELPGESDWAELREAQAMATRTLPHVGMAVTTDVGEEKDIHPRRKGPVGARLAVAARKVAYGENLIAAGPTYRSMSIKGDRAILHFDNVGLGLEAREVPAADLMKLQNSAQVPLVYEVKSGHVLKALMGFSIAGEDGRFRWANAAIDGDTVVVSSPDVEKPMAVRYGWADYPVVNLWNKNGLPASPFRTDNFPMLTAPKKN